MIHEFVDFVHEIFPSIQPYTKDQVKKAIRQFEQSGELYEFFLTTPLAHLAQGDIIETLPFVTYDKYGNEKVYKTKGILLSNTCDCENDDNIVFSPLLPVKHFNAVDNERFTRNLTYNLLYFPDTILSDHIVDLGIMNTFPKAAIEQKLERREFKKVFSLNKFGYYLFLSKLTVHLMRPEDLGVQKVRAI
ncbi:hypothetical protein ACQKGI_19885 [Peribacillus muralis]|uniref:hypothetical protein n=1 Tax=Peribacillus muralis TaxID=264697 RepID=UPI00382567BB